MRKGYHGFNRKDTERIPKGYLRILLIQTAVWISRHWILWYKNMIGENSETVEDIAARLNVPVSQVNPRERNRCCAKV